jgi:hypothetical protein
MSLKKISQGLFAALACAVGLASSASAQTTCTAGGCECKFTWGTTNQDCKNSSTPPTFRANQAFGVTSPPGTNNHTVQVSLVAGVSSSNIPITSGGTLFPEFCRATDQTKNGSPVFKGCSSTLVPAKHRVLVG